SVGVPEQVAEPVHATAVVGLQELAALVDVRDVGEGLVAEAALAEGGAPGPRVQLAVESLRERQLLVVAERLVTEHEDGVVVHPGPDPRERLAVVHPAELDRAHLRDEVTVQRPERQGHASEPRTTMGGESSSAARGEPRSEYPRGARRAGARGT